MLGNIRQTSGKLKYKGLEILDNTSGNLKIILRKG